ncbi:serine hydrolase domain-containing protein [Cellulomonas sp. CW35]|uniref:serine hydrolase domain-containing protein n=1 Tax=unclassified Cellulomonas TaxID=2620175 RepID=UPI000B8D6622|nr:serine hydrolase [Cellulomonas sp. PSBB021]ASR55573.1 serine hydrolase [Cellulomonas sp. PSBB021]
MTPADDDGRADVHGLPETLPRSTPEEQGVDPRGLAALVRALAGGPPEQELRALVVVRHGHVVAEGARAPYATDRRHALYSLSKTFTATAAGFAVDEGLLRLDDLVVDLAPDEVPTSGLSDDERARLGRMTVRDLLTMRSGHDVEPNVFEQRGWVAAFLAAPLQHEPGTHFLYNTAATYVLSALVERATGQGLLAYLRPRLLDPLGFADATWEVSPEGHATGGFGMSAAPRDVAAFGELLLRDGAWRGRRLLPEGWVALASHAHVPPGTAPGDERSDWSQGYGFQMWRSRHGFRGDGAFGQFCLVLPEQDVVVAMSSAVGDMQTPLDLVWEHLLPACGDAPLAPDDAGRAALAEAFAGLRVTWPQGRPTSPVAARLDGRRVRFDPNPLGVTSATVRFGDAADRVEVRLEGDPVALELGHDEPVGGALPPRYPGMPGPEPVVAHAVWTTRDEYVATVRALEDTHVLTVTAKVTGDLVEVTPRVTATFGPTDLPTLRGVLADHA